MRPQGCAIRRFLFLSSVLVCACHGRRASSSLAAVLPGLGNLFGNDKKNEPLPPPPRGGVPPPRPLPRLPPPGDRPPPPPPRTGSQEQKQAQVGQESMHGNPQGGDESTEHDDSIDAKEKGKPEKPPPPPPRLGQQDQQSWDPYSPFSGIPPPPIWGGPPVEGNMWGPPPQQQYGDWMSQQQQQPYYGEGNEFVDDDIQILQREIDDRIAHEQELINQIQNMTASLAIFQQREDLHVRQLDVLTERVMDAEAETASERNELVEYRANCTALGRTVALLQDELEEWKSQCETLREQHEVDEERVRDIQETLKERDFEVEQLASSIEAARLSNERARYLADRKQKKSRGFFSWLFGFGRDESDDDEERLQELAKSTLLRALQRERNNVDELEAALSILQQNNSAISEMVDSRDMLINELNDRVAVFEEDKVVLKAALRQLQKEMKEEAPKTQKLIHDLRLANEEINNLNAEIQSLISTHQDEVGLLQDAIMQKQNAINETESNLTVIGTYVDKLEERLATFAISRRDIEIREKKCKEIEERAVQAERERDEMRKKVEDFIVEREDIKKLMEALVKERSALQQDKVELTRERDALFDAESSLRDSIASLEQDVENLDSAAAEWRAKVVELELELEVETDRARDAQKQYDELLAATLEKEREAEELRTAEVPESPSDSDDEDVVFYDAESADQTFVPSPPTLPSSTGSTETPKTDTGKTKGPPSDSGSVPLRNVRKFFSSRTGMYGVFKPSSTKPPLTGSKSMPNLTTGKSQEASSDRDGVPLRKLRKFFSARTGMHGVFTPSSTSASRQSKPQLVPAPNTKPGQGASPTTGS